MVDRGFLAGLVLRSRRSTLAVHVLNSRQDEIKSSRNFHGILRILDEDSGDRLQHRYTLKNGRIEHGFQFQEEKPAPLADFLLRGGQRAGHGHNVPSAPSGTRDKSPGT